MFNRRYAFLGWLVWSLGKQFGRTKARQAVPGVDKGTKRPNRPAIVATLAAVGGALWILGKRTGGGDADLGGGPE